MSYQATFRSDGFTPDGLIANNPTLLISVPVTLLAGQNQVRGALLGRITASGKYVLSTSAATDGSQVPAGILVDDVDATSGDKPALIYIRGDFISSAVIFGAGQTAAGVATVLRDQGIFLINAQGGV